MAATRNSTGVVVGANNLITHGVGGTLSVSSNTITITDSFHLVSGAGTIHTISVSGGNPSAGAELWLMLDTGATATFQASGGNIAGTAPTPVVGVPIHATWQGSAWYFDAAGSFATATQTLTNKTIALGSNTVSGTLAQLNTAITDADIARTDAANTLVGDQTLSTGELIISGATKGVKERARTTPMGEWISVAHAGTNFTASAGTWTVDAGDQTLFKYTLVGKTMTVMVYLINTSVSATPASLKILIPGGFTAASTFVNAMSANNAGGGTYELGQLETSGTFINCYRNYGISSWSIATNSTNIIGQITFEIA